MTAQEPDLIRFEPDGEIHALCTNPLADWLYDRGIGSRSRGTGWQCTSNQRGYVASFLVHDDHLWIEDVRTSGDRVVVARRRPDWFMTPEGKGEARELEPEESWRKRAELIDPEERSFNLEGIFPKADRDLVRDDEGRVRADWFSGELRIPQGEMRRYVHGGYGSEYERDHLVLIERGVVIRGWTRAND